MSRIVVSSGFSETSRNYFPNCNSLCGDNHRPLFFLTENKGCCHFACQRYHVAKKRLQRKSKLQYHQTWNLVIQLQDMSFIVILQRSYCYYKKTCSAIYIDVSNVSRLRNSTMRFVLFFQSRLLKLVTSRKVLHSTMNEWLKDMSFKAQYKLHFLKQVFDKEFGKILLARASNNRGTFNENSNDNKLHQKQHY